MTGPHSYPPAPPPFSHVLWLGPGITTPWGPPLPPACWHGASQNPTLAAATAGMVRRVSLLLLSLVGLGALLFYLGLQYAFPEGP